MRETNERKGSGLEYPELAGPRATRVLRLTFASICGGNPGHGGPIFNFPYCREYIYFDKLGLHCKKKTRNRSESLYM